MYQSYLCNKIKIQEKRKNRIYEKERKHEKNANLL